MTALTQARLKELLHYDPDTGVWTWRTDHNSRARSGDVAGRTCADGYRQIGVDGRSYQAHRLAFLYLTGRWPVAQVDHRDLDRANNAWLNLREASHQQNQWNRGANRTNTSGFKGVGWNRRRQKWRAMIYLQGRGHYLGYFDTPEVAHAAYCAAAHRLHGQFARTA